MSLPRYPKYKDSGVEWLGKIPSHWEVKTLKHIVATPITDGPHETPKFVEEGVPFVSAEAVSSGHIDFSKVRACISPEDNARYSMKYSPRLHDIYMVKSGATTGITAMVENRTDFNIWSPLAVIRCGPIATPRFVLHFMRSRHFLEAVTLYWSFGTQQNIGMGVIENLACTVPPSEEQKAIATFLDRETANIAALVAEQERLIELLKEKRQAVISHAVTKGLNPDVPMKDSGVGWLGNVPAHWDVKKFKSLSSIISKGTTPTTIGADFTEHGIRFLKAENVTELGVSRFPEFYIAQEAHAALSRSALQGGDVLVVIAGATTGKSAVLDDSLVPANTNQAVSFIRPLNKAYSPYISLWLSTKLVRDWIGLTSVQSAQPNLSMEDLGNIPIPVPPPEELSCLMAKLGASLGEFSALTTEAQRAIDLLQERRTALISAAVTGQIDVREAAGRAA